MKMMLIGAYKCLDKMTDIILFKALEESNGVPQPSARAFMLSVIVKSELEYVGLAESKGFMGYGSIVFDGKKVFLSTNKRIKFSCSYDETDLKKLFLFNDYFLGWYATHGEALDKRRDTKFHSFQPLCHVYFGSEGYYFNLENRFPGYRELSLRMGMQEIWD